MKWCKRLGRGIVFVVASAISASAAADTIRLPEVVIELQALDGPLQNLNISPTFRVVVATRGASDSSFKVQREEASRRCSDRNPLSCLSELEYSESMFRVGPFSRDLNLQLGPDVRQFLGACQEYPVELGLLWSGSAQHLNRYSLSRSAEGGRSLSPWGCSVSVAVSEGEEIPSMESSPQNPLICRASETQEEISLLMDISTELCAQKDQIKDWESALETENFEQLESLYQRRLSNWNPQNGNPLSSLWMSNQGRQSQREMWTHRLLSLERLGLAAIHQRRNLIVTELNKSGSEERAEIWKQLGESEKTLLSQWTLSGVSQFLSTDQAHGTALHWAMEKGSDKLVQWLIDRGADINHQDAFGDTPLMRAIHQRRLALILSLADRAKSKNDLKINWRLTNRLKQTALQLASDEGGGIHSALADGVRQLGAPEISFTDFLVGARRFGSHPVAPLAFPIRQRP